MSLRTADFFYRAVRTSEDVTAIVSDRVFIPARPTVDEMEDKIPYIIIEPGQVTNIVATKDDAPEGQEDSVTVRILCVAENHDALIDLCETVRERCADYWNEHRDATDAPFEWSFSASDEMLDQDKPCNYITMTYQCQTNRN